MEKITQTHCAYKSCRNDHRENKSIRYFCFPKDESRREKWIKNSGNYEFLNTLSEDKIRRHRICEIHFEDHCFTNNSHQVLIKHAVPIPFITPPTPPKSLNLELRAPIITPPKSLDLKIRAPITPPTLLKSLDLKIRAPITPPTLLKSRDLKLRVPIRTYSKTTEITKKPSSRLTSPTPPKSPGLKLRAPITYSKTTEIIKKPSSKLTSLTPSKSPGLRLCAPIRTYSNTTEITKVPSITSINVQDIKLEKEDEEVSESLFHSEFQKDLPFQEQQSDTFSNLCRSCANQYAYLIPIDVMTSVGISVNAIFNEIGLTISDDDEFPKKICETCLDEIILVHKFYKKILNSKSVFERLLLKENYSEPVDIKKENDAYNEEEDDNNLELMEIDEDDPLFECSVPEVCSICGTNQLQNDQMLDHKLSQHVPVSNQADFTVMTCPYCKTEFSIMLWYDEHLKKKCLGQSKPNCIVCKLNLRPKYLVNHLKEWHMLKKNKSDSFRCIASESCTYFSNSVLMLNEHQMAEHDKSLYVCKDCGLDYIASQKLLVHCRTHEKGTSVL